MFKSPRPFRLLLATFVAGLCLAMASEGQEAGGRAAAPAEAARAEEIVVRVEVEGGLLDQLDERFEVLDIERLTRSRSAVRLVLERSQLGELDVLAPRVEIDESATAERALRRARGDLEARSRSGARSLVSADAASTTGITNYECYRTVEETYTSLSALATTHPNLASWLDMGDSLIKIEGPGAGYDLGVLKITDSDFAGPKAPFVILAATHAREYVTAETATRFGEYLVQNHGTDPDVTAFLRHVVVWIMPVHNPDGRKVAESEYAISSGQRKNLRDTCASSIDGVDLNRNSEQYFRFVCGLDEADPDYDGDDGGCSTGGYSVDACSNLYSGPDWPNDGGEDPEPETVAANDLMAIAFDEQWTPEPPDDAEGLFISVHSFGEYVLFPWEARWNDAPNFIGLRTLGRRLGHRLPGYTVCQDCFGTAAGTNVDEAYGRYGVAAYTFELGTAFHQDCSGAGTNFEDDIWPQALEALMLGLKSARRPYLEPGGPEIHSLSWTTQTFLPGESLVITGVADDTRVDWDPGVTGTDADAQPEHDITNVFYSVDLPPWDPSAFLMPLAAVDALYDSSVEAFSGSIDTSGLGAGSHVVWIVAEDDEVPGGQRGVATAVLIEENSLIFADGFESGNLTAWSP